VIKFVSWNVAGRTVLLEEQIRALDRREPDIVALQEVTKSTVGRWKRELADSGLKYSVDSDGRSPRRLFNLTASRWPLVELPPAPVPQAERVLSAMLESNYGPIRLHNVHIPPAPSQGSVKIETIEALASWLAVSTVSHRILCGDFNTPRREYADGSLDTFARNHPDEFLRWDQAERRLLTGLKHWDLSDVFRTLNGYENEEDSWFPVRRTGKPHRGHRLDHLYASVSMRAMRCEYIHGWRENGLSDHSAIEAIFDPVVVARD